VAGGGVNGLAELQAIGRDDSGTTRLPWTAELRAADAWFAAQAEDCGLSVERDPAGNLWAVPDSPPPWWGVGSHLDSVREGGAWDGALGVAAAFEVARRTEVPVAVVSFADEEGARFNQPTFGSRALTGQLDLAVLDRRDAEGVLLRDALAAYGVDPDGVARAPEWLPRLRGFLELHIDQSREVWDLGVPAAAVSGLAARLRLRAVTHGRANHAGTTSMADRRDALHAMATQVVRALDVEAPLRATATRLVVEPNALSTIPERVTAWFDCRAPHPDALDAWLDEHWAGREHVVESRSDGVAFDPEVRAALGGPEVPCFAGHDAGLLAARIPAGMVLVRNERGVSHAPDEHVELADAEAGVEMLVRALELLA
jgi:beta-ureidopropionase / N-carbamoyl-L-amino-acid hydrolase